MLIRLGYEIIFHAQMPTPMMLMLYTHPSRQPDLRQPDEIRSEPEVPIQQFTDWFGNRCGRIVMPAGTLRLWNDTLVEDSGLPDPVLPDIPQHPVEELPPETLQYLMSSRYCEVDRLSDIAWEIFGTTPSGGPRVKAICDWVHSNVKFGYQFARPTKTAYEVYLERQGVCRDFTHLAVTFCRCLAIPARYVTGYLGDIGVPPSPSPMDFSAWFEVYLGGRWHTWDARHNSARIGRVLMARGRDATDVALTTSFGPTLLNGFKVWTDDVTNPKADGSPANAAQLAASSNGATQPRAHTEVFSGSS